MEFYKNKSLTKIIPVIIASFIVHGTVLFVFCSIYVFVLMLFKNNYKIYKKLDILPFLIIWGLGVVSSFVNFDDISFHEVLRFSFYVFTPIVSIILGYIISRDDNKVSIYKTIFLCGSLICFKYLYEIVISLPGYGITLDLFRANKHNLSSLVVIALSIYIMSRINRQIIIGEKIDKCLAAICFFSVITSMSRYLIVALIVSISIILFENRRASRAFQYALRIIVFVALVFLILYALPETRDLLKMGADKFLSSSSELSLNVTSWGEQEVNSSWRGYEMSCALKQFISADFLSQLFGIGLRGVDVGRYASLVTDTSSTYLPLLHNGFLGILIFSGIVGLFMYVGMILRNIKYASKKLMLDKNDINILAIIIMAIVSISTFIVTGPISSIGISFDMLVFGMVCAVRRSTL